MYTTLDPGCQIPVSLQKSIIKKHVVLEKMRLVGWIASKNNFLELK